MKGLEKELLALETVLQQCLGHCRTLLTAVQTEEAFGPGCEISSQPPEAPPAKKSRIKVSKEPKGYIIQTEGKYKGVDITSLARANPKGLRKWAKEDWKDLHAEDKQHIKEMLKSGGL